MVESADTSTLSATSLAMVNGNENKSSALNAIKVQFQSPDNGLSSFMDAQEINMVSENGFFASISNNALIVSSGADTSSSMSDTQVLLQNSSGSGAITSLSMGSLVVGTATDSLTLTPTLSASAGGSSDQYLVVTINGTAYRISLLSPPDP
jgi:hypothetical protein